VPPKAHINKYKGEGGYKATDFLIHSWGTHCRAWCVPGRKSGFGSGGICGLEYKTGSDSCHQRGPALGPGAPKGDATFMEGSRSGTT
jgi:hypothetical protein